MALPPKPVSGTSAAAGAAAGTPAAPCAACGKPLADADAALCAICRRRVCVGCLRPYGHHMLACEECRLEPW